MADRREYPPTDLPLYGWQPYDAMHLERIRAHKKHRDKPGGSMEMKDHDDPDWIPVLTEELGEVAKVINDHRHGLFTDAERDEKLQSELIQVGAMTAAWLDAITETTRARELDGNR